MLSRTHAGTFGTCGARNLLGEAHRATPVSWGLCSHPSLKTGCDDEESGREVYFADWYRVLRIHNYPVHEADVLDFPLLASKPNTTLPVTCATSLYIGYPVVEGGKQLFSKEELEPGMGLMGWNGMEWNGMGWKGMERDGMGWNEMEWDRVGWKGMEWDGMWDGRGWNGMEWD